MTFYPSLLIQVWGITGLVPRGDAFGFIFEWTMDHGQKTFQRLNIVFSGCLVAIAMLLLSGLRGE